MKVANSKNKGIGMKGGEGEPVSTILKNNYNKGGIKRHKNDRWKMHRSETIKD